MHIARIQHWLVPALVLALAPMGAAETWIVDDDGGPGVHFTELSDAVAAATAGDTILVEPGTYMTGGLSIDKPLRILGTGADPYEVYLLGAPEQIEVRGVTGGQPVVLANFSGANRMEVWDCTAPVIVIDVALAVRVNASSDVRVHGMQQPVYGPSYAYALNGSRFEGVGVDFQGNAGSPANCVSGGGPGGTGFSLTASRGHLSNSTSTGGTGGYLGCSTSFGYGGDGGSGISVSSSTLILSGAPGNAVTGGQGGGTFSGGCSFAGLGGTGLWTANSLVLHSNFLFEGGAPGDPCTLPSLAGDPTSEFGTGGLAESTPPMPWLELIGTPSPGATITLRTHARTSSFATLFLGRKAIVEPEEGIEVEKLTNRVRTIYLGSVPPGGFVDRSIKIPGWMDPGFVFFAQAQMQLPEGDLFNTNSIPILIR